MPIALRTCALLGSGFYVCISIQTQHDGVHRTVPAPTATVPRSSRSSNTTRMSENPPRISARTKDSRAEPRLSVPLLRRRGRGRSKILLRRGYRAGHRARRDDDRSSGIVAVTTITCWASTVPGADGLRALGSLQARPPVHIDGDGHLGLAPGTALPGDDVMVLAFCPLAARNEHPPGPELTEVRATPRRRGTGAAPQSARSERGRSPPASGHRRQEPFVVERHRVLVVGEGTLERVHHLRAAARRASTGAASSTRWSRLRGIRSAEEITPSARRRAEGVDARVLEQAPDDRHHADVVRDARHARAQAADAAHVELHLTPAWDARYSARMQRPSTSAFIFIAMRPATLACARRSPARSGR